MFRIQTKMICLSLIGIIFLACIPSTYAYQDERISVYFYFTWMNEDGSWHEWRNISKDSYIKGQSLQVGQPIKCKIVVISHVQCNFGFELSELGSPRAFDLLEGTYDATELGQGFLVCETEEQIEEQKQVFEEWNILAEQQPKYLLTGDTFEYEWVLQPNSNYVDEVWSGLSLNCDFDAQGSPLGNDVIIGVSFTEAVISGEWTGPSYTSGDTDPTGDTTGNGDTTDGKKSTPGFELPLLFISLGVLLFVIRRRNNR